MLDFFGDSVSLVVEEADSLLKLYTEVLYELGEDFGKVGQRFVVRVVEVDPYLRSIAYLGNMLAGDKAEASDVFSVVKRLPDDEEHPGTVDVLVVLLRAGDRDNEASSFGVLRILPFGLDAFLEELE